MPELPPGLGESESDSFRAQVETGPVRRDTVLVVSGARVTTTVISRIVTMAGLKSQTTDPEDFDQAAHQPRLAAIILDDDVQLASRIALIGPEGRPAQRPVIILMATAGCNLEAGRNCPHCDAVLPKPIISDTLYPVLFDIRQKLAFG